MYDFFSFVLLTFSTFFPMVDPIGLIPIFASLTHGLNKNTILNLSLKATSLSFMLILFFAFLGKYLFSFFGISVDGLKVVGGVIFFIMGHEMLAANPFRQKDGEGHSSTSTELSKNYDLEDLALTPLAIPLICGPGAITNSIIMMEKAQDTIILKMAFVLGSFLIMSLTLLCLVGANQLVKVIGPRGIKVVVRLMGLLLMVLAVESFFNGLTPILQKILKI